VKPFEDNMLKVCGDGRSAALWLPLVGITPTGPGKIERCAANVARLYHKHKGDLYPDRPAGRLFHPRPGALHVIFCDMGTPKDYEQGSVYDYVKALLVHAGVPEKQIRFIHEAKSHAARRDLFAECRAGHVAVLIGSTEKMGTGVNIQRRLKSIHELDHPWRPSDVEQRHGRGDRPGNDNEELLIFRYATKQSFDAYTLQGLERKIRFIKQVLTGAAHIREVEAADNPQVLSYGELKAMATGQPLLLELSEVQAKIAKLRNSGAGHKRTQARLFSEQRDERGRARSLAAEAEHLRSIAALAASWGERHPEPMLTLDDGTHLLGEEIPAVIAEKLAAARRNRDATVKFGQWCGVYLTADLSYRKGGTPAVSAEMRKNMYIREAVWVGHVFGAWDRKTGAETVLAKFAEAIGDAPRKADDRMAKSQACLDRAKEIEPYLGTAWPGAEELAALLDRRRDIEKEIDMQVKDTRKVPQPA
jgi:hypothetical protein